MNWLHYLLEANLYLAVFYAGYCLFLNKETYYTLNRIYLLLSCVISFLIPILQIGALKPTESVVKTVAFVIPNNTKPVINQVAASHITMPDVLLYTYLLGVVILTIVLLFKLFKLAKMTKTTNKLVNNKYHMVNIEGSNTAFSFFNYLFIGTKTAGSETIIRHELVHIRQKHSVDIVFMEVIKIINWFNPFIYLLQISLKTVHEYIADEQTAAFETDALSYSSFLVNNAYGLNGPSVTHSFFNYNLLKKRIIMLHQKRSGSLARLKYLMAVPICAGMLCASTLGFSKTYGWVDLAPAKNQPITKVIPHKNNWNDGKFIYVIKPALYRSSKLEEIKIQLQKHGYKITYSEQNMGTKHAQVYISIEKMSKKGSIQNVYQIFNLEEMKKGGYVIMFGGDEKLLFISDKLKENSVNPKDIDELPPPPKPARISAKMPPPPPPAPPKTATSIEAPQQPELIAPGEMRSPPSPPSPFDSLVNTSQNM